MSYNYYYLEITEKDVIYQVYKEHQSYEQIKEDFSVILLDGNLRPNWW